MWICHLILVLIPACECAVLRGVNVSAFGAKTWQQEQIVNAFLHGWKGYRSACWGYDELKPVSQNCTNEWGGFGAQIVDVLDTLLLMDLQSEYSEARYWIHESFSSVVNRTVSVFEITIRILGGLLSASLLQQDSDLLLHARLLGKRLLSAWSAGPIPSELVNLMTGERSATDAHLGSSLAEVGTIQLEFTSLSMATGDMSFRYRAEQVMDFLTPLLNEKGGLLPIMLHPSPPMHFTNHRVTLGGRGDSFYEYLLKQWLLTNRSEEKYLEAYRGAIRAVRRCLIGKSHPSNFTFLREADSIGELRRFLHPDSNLSWDAAADANNVVIGPLGYLMPVFKPEGQEGQALPPVEQGQGDVEELPGEASNTVPAFLTEGKKDFCEIEDEHLPQAETDKSQKGESELEAGQEESKMCQQRSEGDSLAEQVKRLFAEQDMLFVSVRRMIGAEVCAVAEQLRSGRWDLVHRYIGVQSPGRAMNMTANVLDTVANVVSGMLDQNCEALGYLKMDHLSCFLPGVLALGAMTGAADDAGEDLRLAAELTEACAHMWKDTSTHLAPESISWNVFPGRDRDLRKIEGSEYSILRPETVESLWYLYLATGERKYQDYGWEIFQAIERHAHVPSGGYSGVDDVFVPELNQIKRRDRMETFVLSETFKYLFLLFADEGQPYDLTQVVLNTEGHPLPVVDRKHMATM